MGAESSATRAALLDAAERLMAEEGGSAVGVRRLARELGVTPALVHYYFRSLDDLLLAVLNRNAAREVESLEALRTSERPLHALWERSSRPEGAAITTEFLALANRSEALRREIARHAARFRAIEVEIIGAALGERARDLPPVAVSALIAILARTIVLEDGLGLSEGHAELLALVRRHLDELEPE